MNILTSKPESISWKQEDYLQKLAEKNKEKWKQQEEEKLRKEKLKQTLWD